MNNLRIIRKIEYNATSQKDELDLYTQKVKKCS